jgi:hypothetical protein
MEGFKKLFNEGFGDSSLITSSRKFSIFHQNFIVYGEIFSSTVDGLSIPKVGDSLGRIHFDRSEDKYGSAMTTEIQASPEMIKDCPSPFTPEGKKKYINEKNQIMSLPYEADRKAWAKKVLSIVQREINILKFT